ETIEFPDGERIFRRNLAAHLRDDERFDSMLSGEVAHLIFARRHNSRYEERLAFRALQSGGEPDDVTRWPTDIEPGDDTENFHSGQWSVVSGQINQLLTDHRPPTTDHFQSLILKIVSGSSSCLISSTSALRF